MAGQYRFKDINGNIVAQISASSAGAISFSGSAVDFSNASTITLGEVQLAGTASNALLLDGFDSTAFVFTSSFNTISQSISSQLTTLQTTSGSNIGRLNNLESKSSSVDISISNINSVTASNIARLSNLETKSSSVDISITNINSVTASNLARLTNLETKSASVDISVSSINTFTSSNGNTSLNNLTGSLATTGSNSFYGTQVFSGSVYIANDLIVQGSSSIQYISASSVSIGTNIVQLNTANPSVRFAGLTIIDSGSIGGSGSFLYDSVHDEFVFVHRGNGTNVTSSHFVLGPETYDNLGNELYLTCNVLTKGTGKEHLVDSCIFDNGTTTCIKNNLVGTGTACFTGNTIVSTSGNTTLTINGTSGVPALSFINTGGTNNIYGGVGSTANITIAPGDVNAVKIFAVGCVSCFVGAITTNGGLIIAGSPTGYPLGELQFSLTANNSYSGISTLGTGTTTLYFDHRATSNTGNFVFRNGTAAANTLLTIAGSGAITATNTINVEQSNSAASTQMVITNTSNASTTTKTSQLLFKISDTAGTQKNSAYIQAIPDGINVLDAHLAFGTRVSDNDSNEKMRITSTGIACFSSTVCAPYIYVGKNAIGDTTNYGLSINRHGDLNCSHAYTTVPAFTIGEFSNAGPVSGVVDTNGIWNLSFGRYSHTMACSKFASLMFIGYDGAMGPLRVDGRGNMFVGYDRSTANGSDATFSLLVACGITAGSYQYCVPPSGGALFSGCVGIGTSNPAQSLEVNGNILASSTGKIGFRYSSGDGNYYSYLRSGTAGSIGPIILGGGFESGGAANEAIRFVTNANPGERCAVSILNNGKFGIGTIAPSTQFQIRKNYWQFWDERAHGANVALFSVGIPVFGAAIVQIAGSRYSPGSDNYIGFSTIYIRTNNVGAIAVFSCDSGTYQPSYYVNGNTVNFCSPYVGNATNYTGISVSVQASGHNNGSEAAVTVTLL